MHRIPRGALRAALVPTLLVGTPALADPEAAHVTLPELSVAGAAGSVTVPSVASQREALNATVGSVAFVDAEGFQNRYANTLRDVLKDTPGVYVQERYGQEIRLSVRGSGISRGYHLRGIEVLQDGIPFNLADGSGDFYQIDPLALRSAELYKGGNALIFGATTLGGAVNFVTPTAYTAFAPNILRFEGGSFGAMRENVQVSRIFGPVDVLLNGTVTNSDGFRQHETQRTQNFNANLGYQIAPGIETRFYLGAYLTDPSHAVSIPTIVFADLKLQQLATDPETKSIDDLPYPNIDHLRDCLRELKSKQGKKSKTVIRYLNQDVLFRTLEKGFYVAKSDGGFKYFPMPSHDELETVYFHWWRSAQRSFDT